MRNADCRVLLLQKLTQRLVDQSFGFGVQSASSFVEDENVRLLDESARDGYALLLAT